MVKDILSAVVSAKPGTLTTTRCCSHQPCHSAALRRMGPRLRGDASNRISAPRRSFDLRCSRPRGRYAVKNFTK